MEDRALTSFRATPPRGNWRAKRAPHRALDLATVYPCEGQEPLPLEGLTDPVDSASTQRAAGPLPLN